MSRSMVYLSNATVRSVLTMREVMQIVEETLRMQADPESIVWGVPLAYAVEDRKLGFKWRLKTVILRQIPIAGVRITGYKISPEGIGGGGEPESTRFIMLSDPRTGSPVAIIDEHWSFALRTTASACVGAKYLARPDSSVVGVIGVGNVGTTFLLGAREIFPIREVRATSRRPESRRAFATKMSDEIGVPVLAAESYEEVCRGADIIVTGTPAVTPFLSGQWLKPGVFVAALGPDEVETGAYARADKIVVDYDRDHEPHPASLRRLVEARQDAADPVHAALWEVVVGRKPGREGADERIILYTVGLTAQDIAIAHALYQRALADSMGLRVPLD